MRVPTRVDIQRFRQSERASLLACIGLALFFWTLNKLSNSYRDFREVQLVYRLPPGKAFSAPPLTTIKATIQGKGWDFIINKKAKVTVTVNADSFQVIQSSRIKDIVADQLGLTSDAVHLDFDEIKIKVEDESKKIVPIQIVTALDFRKGYDLSQPIKSTPSEVEVTGPKSLLDTLKFIATDTLKLNKLREDAVKTIAITRHPLLKYSLESVEAAARVEQFTEKSMFVPVNIKNPTARMKIFPNKIKLTCTIALSQYNKINSNNFWIEIDFNGIMPGASNTIPIVISKRPENVRAVIYTPKSVEYYFEK